MSGNFEKLDIPESPEETDTILDELESEDLASLTERKEDLVLTTEGAT